MAASVGVALWMGLILSSSPTDGGAQSIAESLQALSAYCGSSVRRTNSGFACNRCPPGTRYENSATRVNVSVLQRGSFSDGSHEEVILIADLAPCMETDVSRAILMRKEEGRWTVKSSLDEVAAEWCETVAAGGRKVCVCSVMGFSMGQLVQGVFALTAIDGQLKMSDLISLTSDEGECPPFPERSRLMLSYSRPSFEGNRENLIMSVVKRQHLAGEERKGRCRTVPGTTRSTKFRLVFVAKDGAFSLARESEDDAAKLTDFKE